MPELPEVETVRRDIDPQVRERNIVELSITEPRMVRRSPSPSAVSTACTGRRILSTARRGKFLLFDLDGPMTLCMHLGMSGTLSYFAPGDETVGTKLADRHAHVVAVLDDGSTLILRDPRMFGEVFITPDFESTVPMGIEPLEAGFDGAALLARLASRAPIKSALLDQKRVAGIGNIYADEALFRAGIHPLRPAASVTSGESALLAAAIRELLAEAIELRGSSISDYRDASGRSGGMQNRHKVYGRSGPCLSCGSEVEKTVVAGRGTHFCPRCQPQKAPKRRNPRAQ